MKHKMIVLRTTETATTQMVEFAKDYEDGKEGFDFRDYNTVNYLSFTVRNKKNFGFFEPGKEYEMSFKEV